MTNLEWQYKPKLTTLPVLDAPPLFSVEGYKELYIGGQLGQSEFWWTEVERDGARITAYIMQGCNEQGEPTDYYTYDIELVIYDEKNEGIMFHTVAFAVGSFAQTKEVAEQKVASLSRLFAPKN